MKSITRSLLESLNESISGNTIKEYAMNYLDGYIDNDVTDTEIDMSVAFSFDFNEEPDADFKAYSDFMNLIAERTKVVEVQKSSYGDTLVCDFSSVFKPYNEQLKEFFNMDNSEFSEDEAYYEAVANLEALISGNAGDSTYRELIDILNSKPMNEASNLESIIDEAARYLFNEGDKDYLPDYEEFNDYTMDISKDLFDKAKERALEALTNLAEHQYYDHDGGYGTVLELNDNHTIWELNNESKSYEEWASIVNSKQAQFKADTGVDLLLLGRMGRHACVEPTYDNCINFTYLQETQEKLEQEAIDEFNAEEMNESLSHNSGRKYVSKNVYVMNYKGTYIVLYHGHNEKEFDNETDAFSYAKKLAKEKNEKLKESADLTAEVTYHDEDGTRDYTAGKLSDGRYFLIGQQEQIVVSDKDLPSLAKKDMDDFSYDEDGDKEFIEALENGTTLDKNSNLAKIIIKASRKYLNDGCYLLSESTNIDVNNLTKEQLWKLRQEIVLGSLYTHDYDNSFGIDPSAVCNFFDSFIEDAQVDDYGRPNNREIKEYDNAEDLYNYYRSCENPFGEVENINESTEFDINEIDVNEPNSMETIRKYVSVPEVNKGSSILFDSFRDGYDEYDLRVYPGFADRDGVRAILEPYKLDKDGRYIPTDDSLIELDDFRLDMTDEEVRSLVNNKLGLEEKHINESTELDINDIEIGDSNNMETIRKYVSAQEQHKGTSIRFDTFKAGPYEYDLRIYVGGLTTKDEVRAALIPYKLDEEGRVIRVDKDTIKLDDFRLDMTDEEVRSLVSDKLGLKESLSEIDNDQDLDADQVQADVDYWTDVDEANTEDVTGMEPVGVYSVSNSMAIYVYQIEYDIEDRVLAGDSSDETKARWRDIIYGDGEAYFWYGDIKVPFNEVMRTDI